MVRHGGVLVAAAVLLATTCLAEVVPLPALNIDGTQTSVSGLSAGGFMAVQFAVAYSSVVKGAAVVAGGPYYCAQGDAINATTVCSCTGLLQGFCHPRNGGTDLPALIKATDRNAGNKLIDATAHLGSEKFFLLSGKLDSIVPQPVMNDLHSYLRHYVPSTHIRYKNDLRAEHAMPTDSWGKSCTSATTPFINQCGYDTAGQLLGWIYGRALQPRNTADLSGAFIQFDQRAFIADPIRHGMDSSGWLYVPAACGRGEPCTLHMVLHGCQQAQSYVNIDTPLGPLAGMYGTTFVKHAGYNQWADTNHIVVLYPQAATSAGNPDACWDWWGYDDPAYATRNGRQMAALKAMIDRLAGGH